MNTVLDLEATEEALARGAVAFEGSRDVIEVDGPDAGTYLQGQISQDVLALDIGASTWSFVLAPQGKVDAWFRLTRTSEHSFLLDLDAGFGDAVLTRLQRFKLRTKADLTLRTARSISVRGPAATPVGLGAVGPDSQRHGQVLPAAWPGIDGFDLLDPSHDPALPFGDPAALLALRIRTGQPAMGTELDEHTIPAEAGVVDASVSFTKGCYVGQELVARVDSRGNNTPRKLLGIRLDGTEAPAPGAEVLSRDGAAVGAITSAVATTSGVVAMAYIKRGTDPTALVRVGLGSGSTIEGQLHSFPL